ncbi:MAG: hypothetical protein IPH05_02800 [Flavobacteriales bacterium]|jgi:hypothetical protein|nr:hypothetical protein [Flavobacteriales bacterium]MBK6549955.1 hypothetical protein [Flavobacteriales bacterium]MBK6881878.1 hypothetical protein [Flavobacteriales bacterium]MBK7102466.1 hypothetical protein [Flavobacteriales bacterium]MBK7113206.1 hypothetical protein [Flavobacteriales bacterium]
MRTSIHVVKVVGGLFALAVLASGCLKTEEFPSEPVITFKSFEFFGDSASLIISFTDGDGDVGLDASDASAPFDTSSIYYFNLFVEESERIDGEWNEVTFEDPIYYRIPRITPTGQNKSLEGEIAVAIDPFPLFITGSADTVRFSVRMVDRALNVSNTVFSDDIVVP